MPPTLTCGEHTCGGHTCGGQNAHRVFFFPASRTHAAGSGCGPTPGSCFPGQGESPRLRRASRAAAPGKTRTVFFSSPRLARTRLVPGARPRMAPVFPGREKAPAHPQRTETLEKLSFAPWLFKRFPYLPAVCGRMAAKPASSAEEKKIGRRAQEWGFEGGATAPPRESLSTFFSEESRGPSRPERQMKRFLRGKSEAGKRKNKREKPCTQSARRANGKQAPAARARHKSGRLPASRKQSRRRPNGKQAAQAKQKTADSRRPGTRQRHTGRKNTGHRAQNPPQQRQAAQERPPRQTARHAGRRKTPPNRQNARSLFCLPGGAM